MHMYLQIVDKEEYYDCVSMVIKKKKKKKTQHSRETQALCVLMW